jgi:hypothetical protein
MAVGLFVAGCQSDGGASEPASESAPPLPDGEITIEDPWARPASSGGNSALYLTVANGTQAPDTLTGVRLPIAGAVEIHETYTAEDSTSAMRPVGSVAVPAQARTELAPGGRHVMLRQLSQPLREGESIVVDVDFAQGDLQRIRVPIRTSPPSEGDGGASM